MATKISLKQAIKNEAKQGLTADKSAAQLAIIKTAKPIDKQGLQDIIHGKDVPGIRISDVKAYQQLAAFRINNGMTMFPYNDIKIDHNKIHPLY